MSEGAAPPGWYPDPGGGGQRYFDGSAWTGHTAPWPPSSPWKGARFGRPPSGPGSLADPGRRLAARLLDGLVFLPVFLACAVVALVLVAPHAGPIFPRQNLDPNATVPTPGFVWLYLAVAARVGQRRALRHIRGSHDGPLRPHTRQAVDEDPAADRRRSRSRMGPCIRAGCRAMDRRALELGGIDRRLVVLVGRGPPMPATTRSSGRSSSTTNRLEGKVNASMAKSQGWVKRVELRCCTPLGPVAQSG